MAISPSRLTLLLAGLISAMLIAGCGESSNTEDADGGTADSLHFSHADYPGEWPLESKEATITCEPNANGFNNVILEDELGDQYGLNGTAQDAGYTAIDEIWLDDPEVDGMKLPIDAMLDQGLELCE